jgi:hypothetical protein
MRSILLVAALLMAGTAPAMAGKAAFDTSRPDAITAAAPADCVITEWTGHCPFPDK